MGNFLIPVYESYVVEGANFGGQTSVNAQDLVVDECGYSHQVENPTAITPSVGVTILVLALI